MNPEEGFQRGPPVGLEADGREIGRYATWTVSSAKHGNGVQQLRDGDDGTYWQSDGVLPHVVDIQWNSSIRITEIGLLLDHSADESYTPKKLTIKVGHTHQDLVDIGTYELIEPEGYQWLSTVTNGHNVTSASLVQIVISENHQNGRDTHLRQIKINGPPLNTTSSFASIELSQHANLR